MKIRVLPCQPHCFAFGGFELQMLGALRAAQHAGVDVRPLDVWGRDTDFDILHVWGLEISQRLAIHWARKSGKGVVMTALLPYLTPVTRLRNLASRVLGRARNLRQILPMLDRLVVVNEAQTETAEVMLGIPNNKIAVIPNIIEDQYFGVAERNATFDPCIRDYVICTGNVCQRKNQLNLARAALATNIPLLIVGPVLAGEESYGDALTRLIAGSTSVRWIPGLPAGSNELLAAYRNSLGFALTSYEETQPISALEAAAAGKPLLLADRAWARQSFYQGACLVEPQSLASIEEGLRRLHDYPSRHVPPAEILKKCTVARVGQAYAQAYDQVMRNRFS